MLDSSQNISQEKLIVQEVSQDKHGFDDDPEVQMILDVINKDKKANLFNEIAKYYRENKDIFLFTAMLQDKERLKKIIDIIDKECSVQAKEQFVRGMNSYLDGISVGEHDAKEFLNKEFLNSDLVALFNGPPAPYQGQVRNIHRNLNINVIKLGQALKTSSFFSRKIKRMEEEKSEIKIVNIHSNGKKIVKIEKNEKQQRNYSFTEFAICDIEISWGAKDESGKDLNCAVVLNINSGQISIKKSTIDGKDVESKEILELAKQNEAVLIKGKALCEVLVEHFIKQTPCEEKKDTQSHENIVVPGSGAPSSAIDEEITVEHPSGKAANKVDKAI
ncbi:hypothetical protein [Wolbachia endosymbiont (group A) of Lasioglossum fulvicorne]|uniref:hypothetical protein n=1 Tax=Wolbachia endosymbiont (group A) of Lasioglossum fulvicorne TaxID=3066201 RepID=UPI00334028DA